MRDHSEMDLMLKGYGLTTAKILYHFPDHPHLLQSFIWQDYDLAPKFPARSETTSSLGTPARTSRSIPSRTSAVWASRS